MTGAFAFIWVILRLSKAVSTNYQLNPKKELFNQLPLVLFD